MELQKLYMKKTKNLQSFVKAGYVFDAAFCV